MTPKTPKKKTGPRLVIAGHGGLLAGVERTLDPGDTLVIGRSRSCDLSLRKTKAFDRRSDAPDLRDSQAFNRVSRIHCEIEYQTDGQVAVRDLSQNGTLVDGVRVGRSHLFRVGAARVVVELVDGTWGKLLLTETGAAAAQE